MYGSLPADQPLLAKLGDDGLMRLHSGHPRNRSGASSVMRPSSPITLISGEVVGSADLEVVRVVTRGDLQRAGPELGVHVFLGDHREATTYERQDRVLADQVVVALVVQVHRDRGVREHRLRPNGGDDQLTAVLERIGELIEGVGDLPVLDLEVEIADWVPGSQLTM